MEQNEFEVYYQPIISMGKGRITGMEALLRASYLGEPISPEGLFSYAKKVNKSFELDFLCHMCRFKIGANVSLIDEIGGFRRAKLSAYTELE